MKYRFVIAVCRDLDKIVIPVLAGVAAQAVLRPALDQIERAFDVGGGERLAVMPLDPLAELKGQILAVLAPLPALGEVGSNRTHAVLRDVLIVDDQIVHHAHHRHDDRVGRLLMDRHAGRAVPVLDFRMPPGFCAIAGPAAIVATTALRRAARGPSFIGLLPFRWVPKADNKLPRPSLFALSQ